MGVLEQYKDTIGPTSPLPGLIKLRNFIFGKERPDVFTRISVYINLIIWFLFISWTALSFVTLKFRKVILASKEITIDEIIKARGEELGMNASVFIHRVVNFNSWALLCWAIVFVGLVLMWRKKQVFLLFVAGGLVFYMSMLLFYLGTDYFHRDITLFDKISLAVLLLNSLFFYFMLKRGQNSGNLNPFFEDDL